MTWLHRIGSQWRWLLAAYCRMRPAPKVQSLVHRHVWGACKYNGQYWYARCVASESCTAKIAC